MWSKIGGKLRAQKSLYLKPNKSEAQLAHEAYNAAHDFDFSDGPSPSEVRFTLPKGQDPGRYNINPHTISPFVDSLALEPLTAPKMPAAEPEIVIIPPTPPWATPPGSRTESDTDSDGEGRGRGTHRKALSDTLLHPNQARANAARQARETALALEAIGRAVENLQIQQHSTTTQRAIFYHYPLGRQPPWAEQPAPPSADNTPPFPRDVTPPDGEQKKDAKESPPFEFDD